MKRSSTRLLPPLLSLLWLAGSTAHAEMIHLSWIPDPAVLNADGSANSGVTFTQVQANFELTNLGGTWTGIATQLGTISSASADHPDTFTDRPYSLTLTVTDDQGHSLLPSPVTFSGLLNGTLSRDSAQLSNTFTSLQTQRFFDGNFSVTIGPYAPPGPPAADSVGSIGAQVVVIGEGPPPPPVSNAPEPSTLALSSLGGVLLAWKAWRKRRRR